MKDVQEKLDRLVPEPSRVPEWDEVMSGARACRRRRSRRLVALVASLLVVAVGTASAVGSVRNFFLHTGFIGLPPLGATPSVPESGKLEVFYWVWSPQLRRPPMGPWDGDVGRSRAWVYADGRLIWLREATLPEGANRRSTGFLEQRLSPEGVELLRSEVASHAVACRRDTGGCGMHIQVRDGNRLVPVRWARDLEHSELKRLETRLSDPASWLPASAWEDPKIRAYVPSRFAVCYGWPGHRIDLSGILTLLPAPVEAMLRARNPSRLDWERGPQYCSDVTTEEARGLAKALDDAGFEREGPAWWLAYGFKVPGSIREGGLIFFEPYLPHGEWACSACG